MSRLLRVYEIIIVAIYRYIQVLSFDECQRVKDKICTSRPEIYPLPVHTPLHHIGLDFVGPIFPVSNWFVDLLCQIKKQQWLQFHWKK